jgi:hypothetical protein
MKIKVKILFKVYFILLFHALVFAKECDAQNEQRNFLCLSGREYPSNSTTQFSESITDYLVKAIQNADNNLSVFIPPSGSHVDRVREHLSGQSSDYVKKVLENSTEEQQRLQDGTVDYVVVANLHNPNIGSHYVEIKLLIMNVQSDNVMASQETFQIEREILEGVLKGRISFEVLQQQFDNHIRPLIDRLREPNRALILYKTRQELMDMGLTERKGFFFFKYFRKPVLNVSRFRELYEDCENCVEIDIQTTKVFPYPANSNFEVRSIYPNRPHGRIYRNSYDLNTSSGQLTIQNVDRFWNSHDMPFLIVEIRYR